MVIFASRILLSRYIELLKDEDILNAIERISLIIYFPSIKKNSLEQFLGSRVSDMREFPECKRMI